MHIWLCNSMARSERCIFQAENLALDCPRVRKDFELPLPFKQLRQRWGLVIKLADVTKYPRKDLPKTTGVCTGSAQIGDEVVLLDGLPTPMIIRQLTHGSHTWRLVSRAVVESWVILEDPGTFLIEGALEEFVIS